MDETNNSKKSLSFQMQIGLTRDQINVEGELTLANLKEIACSFVDRKVSVLTVSNVIVYTGNAVDTICLTKYRSNLTFFTS